MADRANTREYWDKIWSNPKRRSETYANRRAYEEIMASGAQSVLEIGCGKGALLKMLVGKVPTIFGIDISGVAVGTMTKRYGIKGLQMDADNIHELAGEYDFIVANHILEHIIADELFLRKCKDLLAPGGQMFIGVPNNCSSPDETEEHVHMYNEASLKEVMEKVFDNCRISHIGNHLFGVSSKW